METDATLLIHPGIWPATLALYIVVALSAGHLLQHLKNNRDVRAHASRYALTLAVISICLTLIYATLIGREYLELLPFSVALAFATVLGLIQPASALSTLSALLFIRPWELAPKNELLGTLPKAFACICIVSWALHLLRSKSRVFFWNNSCSLFVGLLGWLGFASMLTLENGTGINKVLEYFFPTSVLFFLILNSVRSRQDLRLLSRCISVSICTSIFVALLHGYLVLQNSIFGERLTSVGLFGNSNDLAALCLVALPLTLSFFSTDSMQRLFAALGAVIVSILLLGLLLTQSRGGLLGLAATLLLGLTLSRLPPQKKALAIVFAMLLPLSFALFFNRSSDDLDGSESSRWNYVVTGLKMTKSSPIFGVGIDNYPILYEQFSSSFEEWGKRTAHSSWILALAETGIPGFLFFCLFFITLLKRAWVLRHCNSSYLYALVGYGVAMSFLSHTYLFIVYMLGALVLAAHRIERPVVLGVPKKIPPLPDLMPMRSTVRRAALSFFSLLAFSAPLHADESVTLLASSSADKPLGGYTPELTPRIDLSGSRGEVLDFTLRIKGNGCENIQVSPFRADSGKAQINVAFYGMVSITTRNPSFPGAYVGPIFDPLLPIEAPFRVCARSEQPVWIWGELLIANESPSGKFYSELSWGTARIPMTLTTWKMQMPPKPSIPFYSEMSTYSNLKAHYGKWHDGEAELAEKYTRELQKHRVYLLSTHIALPVVEQRGEKPILDFRNKPTAEQSYYAVNIQNRPSWAWYGIPTLPPSELTLPGAASYFNAAQNALTELDQPSRAMVYLWDEPDPKDRLKLLQAVQTVREKAPGIKVMVTTPYSPDIEKSVDIFVPVINQFESEGFPSPQIYRKMQSEGHEVWWYVSCMSHGCNALADTGVPDLVIDRPAAYVRSIGWLSHKYQINAFLYYFVNYAYEFFPQRDAWDSIWDFSGNGDGTLVFPGRPGERGLTQHIPVASIRLKLLRQSSFDADYLAWMEKLNDKPAWFKESFEGIITSTRRWSKNYSEYQRFRQRIGEYLDRDSERIARKEEH